MKTELLLLLIFYGFFIIDLCTIPFRRKIISKKSGQLVLKLTDKSIIWNIAIYVVVAGLYIVVYFRNFGLQYNALLYACGILAVELISRDVSIYKKYGLYEKGIIYDGVYIPYATIIGFPVLKLPEEDQKNYDSKTLVLQTERKGTKMMNFTTEDEYKKVVEVIFSMNPKFNKMV